METERCDRARLALSTAVFGRPFARFGGFDEGEAFGSRLVVAAG